MDYNAAALEMHAKYPGKLTVNSLFEVKDRDALSTAYTPGVAEPCRQIKANPDDVSKYTIKGRVKSNISGYLYKTTRRSPMVLPVIIEV